MILRESSLLLVSSLLLEPPLLLESSSTESSLPALPLPLDSSLLEFDVSPASSSVTASAYQHAQV
eukprot:CAMPEP_0178729094 /NCGR_PEP_ID=MMETSP0699-20121125/28782_1 /TAXON_ID=265572 /ORGANISM="Extubocellulus spinifer, Strain CCMP396" /LENGTH=64 /DNA_ID=CAMNT_0020380989 /DNA_START=1258 /DNA_END=1452 /DNA_ORIENTATION=+